MFATEPKLNRTSSRQLAIDGACQATCPEDSSLLSGNTVGAHVHHFSLCFCRQASGLTGLCDVIIGTTLSERTVRSLASERAIVIRPNRWQSSTMILDCGRRIPSASSAHRREQASTSLLLLLLPPPRWTPPSSHHQCPP